MALESKPLFWSGLPKRICSDCTWDQHLLYVLVLLVLQQLLCTTAMLLMPLAEEPSADGGHLVCWMAFWPTVQQGSSSWYEEITSPLSHWKNLRRNEICWPLNRQPKELRCSRWCRCNDEWRFGGVIFCWGIRKSFCSFWMTWWWATWSDMGDPCSPKKILRCFFGHNEPSHLRNSLVQKNLEMRSDGCYLWGIMPSLGLMSLGSWLKVLTDLLQSWPFSW